MVYSPGPFAKSLFLIVDRDNLFGSSLGHLFAKDGTVVLATGEHVENEDEVVVVPFARAVPQIPDGLYTHVIFVWNKSEIRFLEPLAKKAQEHGARFFVLASQADAKEAVDASEELEYQPFVFVVGDLFGEGRAFTLNKYLEKAKFAGRISLVNMGLSPWRPILYADAVSKIVDLILVSRKVRDVLFIGPSHETTSLSLFHTIQKIDPELLIDFSNENEEEKGRLRRVVSAFEHYDSSSKLQQFYQNIVVLKEKTREVAAVTFAHPKNTTKKQRPLLYVVYILLVLAVIPILASALSFVVGGACLALGIYTVRQGQLNQAEKGIHIAGQLFSLSQTSLGLLQVEAGVFGGGQSVALLHEKVKLAYQGTIITESGLVAYENFSKIVSGKTLAPQDDAAKMVAAIKQFSSELSSVNSETVPVQLLPYYNTLVTLSAMGSGVVDELPQVLGVTSDKSYLVLFQNNMELRPGGGFIGSYATLSLHLGAVKKFSIHDVYDADGQLQGHVEPPFPIRRYIPIVHLYLRDSNFDPDFSQNAKTAAFFLSQETGQRVDGVVGVDLNVLREVLGAAGSVYVPSYSETVTKENFFTIIEKHSEKNFFPGSIQKKAFLNAFFDALVAKVQAEKSQVALVFFQKVPSLVTGKHLLVASADPVLQQAFALSGLSGALMDLRPSGNGIVNDFFGIVEANLGINKVNAFITRDLSQHVTIDDKGNVQEFVSLKLTNTSDGTWPGGSYKNYIRFILPANAILQGVSFNSVDQHVVSAVTNPLAYEAKGFIPPIGLEVDKTGEAGKVLYGFLVGVPQKSALTIGLTYQLPHAYVLSQSQLQYNMLVWKQAGVDEYPYHLTLTLPQSGQFLSGTMAIPKNGSNAAFDTSITQDTQASAFFSPSR